MSKAQKLLVTGAAGFIAYHLIDELLKNGFDIVGVDNLDPFYNPLLKRKNISDLRNTAKLVGSDFQFFKKDILDLKKSFLPKEKFAAVIHLAAKAGVRPSIEDPMGYTQNNIAGTVQVLEFTKDRNIENLVFGSSSSVYGDTTIAPFREESSCHFPISPYAMSKRSGELLAHTYSHLFGIKTAVLRFFTVYGPRQRPDLAIHKFASAITRKVPIEFYGNGRTARDYTYVGDIIHGIESALRWISHQEKGRYEVFNLGGSQVTSLSKLVSLIETSLGRKAILDRLSVQPGDVQLTCADLTKARQVLGYSPRVGIENGISDFIEWFKEQHPKEYPVSKTLFKAA